MYEETLMILLNSNLGSFIKEDILNNNLIKKDQDENYYLLIKNILQSRNNSFLKIEELMNFFKEH